MDAPFFSIVMATHYRGGHIAPSIRSALRQSVGDFELIVVRDGPFDSEDRPFDGHEKVTWLDLPEHTGSQSAPNNRGIAAARGRWIAYLGHDDIWAAGHLEDIARAIASPAAPDVVAAGCLYHGPPGCRVMFVNGLFDAGDARAPFEHFFPPTALAHRAQVAAQIGGWRDPRAIAAPVDADFQLRLAEAGRRFISTGRVTAHKFAAGHRYLSYLGQASHEQEAMLNDARLDDPVAWDAEIEAAKAAGRFMAMRHADYTGVEPGAAFAANRRSKGLDLPPLRPLTEPVTLEQADDPRGLDWHALEPAATPYRWSGPSPRPKLLIPFTRDGFARLSLRVIASHTPHADIEVAGAEGRLATEVTETDAGTLLTVETRLHPSRPTILELHTPAMNAPAAHAADQRRLGLALADIRIEPLAGVRDLARPPVIAMEPPLPQVTGAAALRPKASAVDAQGELAEAPIDGVQFRAARPVPHEDGYLTEIARISWELLGEPIVQVHATTTFPGRIRAWGLHQSSSDRLYVVTGLVRIAVFDCRTGSPTYGRVNTFTISDKNPGLLVIPPNLYHGWKNIGVTEAVILNMPTRMYDYETPDALDLPWDGEAAARTIPFAF